LPSLSSVDTALSLLHQLPILADLPEPDLVSLARQVTFRDYARDEEIFYQGDPADRVWWVHTGRVKIIYHDQAGREVILEIIAPGEAFGGAVLFFPNQPATAKTMEDASIASFSSELYARFLLDHPPVTLKLLRMLGTRHLSMINMQILAGERVERRMAHIIYKLAARVGRSDPGGTLITIPLSRQDLADMSCTTLETAIRTVSRFQKEGLIMTRRGGYILVTDLERLKDLTE
jgi:CRP/FNR family transcriptional regulator, nitrogen oxide reductase regulator